MPFAANLRRLRVDRFLSQRELARRAGLHAVTLTRLEAGAAAPSTRSVRALAATLGVEPRELTAPDEVAELRRVLSDAGTVEPAAGSDDRALASAAPKAPRPGSRSYDERAAQTEANHHADRSACR
jgi:transcriptional regulator with XRE-family HTH domain